MESTLEHLQEIQKKALEAVSSSIVIFDILDSEKPIVYCNESFLNISGYSREEIIGRNYIFLQEDDTEEEQSRRLTSAIQKGNSCKVTIRNYKKDGTLFFIDLTINPINTDDGPITHYIGVYKEVPAQKKQDSASIFNSDELVQTRQEFDQKVKSRTKDLSDLVQKLIESNLGLEYQIAQTQKAEKVALTNLEMLDAIARNFPHGLILVINSDFKVEYSEGEETHMSLMKEFQLIKGTFIDEVPSLSAEEKSEFKEIISQTVEGSHLSFEKTFNGVDYSINTTPLPQSTDGQKRALLVYWDITLEQTAKLDLLNSLKKEHELNELKSRFIAIASHEFRTPLSAINLSTTLIEKLNAPGNEEKRINYLERIKANVKNLVVILDDFLDLSKLEQGKTTVYSENFDLISFSKNIFESLNESKKAGQTISIKSEKQKLNVFLDKKLMHYILLNLMSNAIKYTPEHKSIILNISETKSKLRIDVIDQGMGIPKSEQPHLFQSFFRAKNATNIQGTGLGLTIIKQYTELMDGSIRFASKLHQGTTFTIEFQKKVMP